MHRLSHFVQCFSHRAKALILITIFAIVSPPTLAKFIAVSGNKADTFQNIIIGSVEKTAGQYGDDTYIDIPNGNFTHQLAQVKQFAKVGADAIIIISTSNDPRKTKQLINAAKNIPIVFINQEPFPNLKQLPPGTIYVGSNEKESGTMQMEELAKLAHYKGKVALLTGVPSNSAAIMRTQDVKDVLAKYPNMSLVATAVANWSRNEAYKITKKWLKNKLDFNILVANNDEMIIGAILAMQDAGVDPKSYLTGGIDATQDALREMEKGNLDVTVLQDAIGQGEQAVKISYRLMQNQNEQSTYWIPFRLVTLTNYQQYLIK
ncbi:MAG: hypothetical protein CENE_00491 [Candidatus Celerinatantimonas neptuna]|nr:MAG: hypothetical protein CENE_00491 [Candidatus Celerinatantimonas neptuna]